MRRVQWNRVEGAMIQTWQSWHFKQKIHLEYTGSKKIHVHVNSPASKDVVFLCSPKITFFVEVLPNLRENPMPFLLTSNLTEVTK